MQEPLLQDLRCQLSGLQRLEKYLRLHFSSSRQQLQTLNSSVSRFWAVFSHGVSSYADAVQRENVMLVQIQPMDNIERGLWRNYE